MGEGCISMKRGFTWLLCLLANYCCVALADEPAFRRWAVIASPELRETGLSDLLAAELSAKSIELVEREQIDVITREIELSKLLGADAAGQRLKVGQLSKADALVLLSVIENDKTKFVKLVVSDCRYGSRLRQEYFAMADTDTAKLATQLVGIVEETRARFSKGIDRIVAVSPFLSKNLTHEFDHLQFGLAALLSDALTQQHGVAVLEIEEARAIGKELVLASDQLETRRVPCFVEGEFEIRGRAAADGDFLVRAAVRATDSKQRYEELRYEGASIQQVGQWLNDSVATALLKKGSPGGRSTTLTAAQQRAHLVSRADVFSKVAAFPQAVALREAALIIDESDWTQRVLLVGDYASQLRQYTYGRSDDSTRPFVSRLQLEPEFCRQVRADCRAMLFPAFHHLENLVAARVLNPREAFLLFERLQSGCSGLIQMDVLDLGMTDHWQRHCWSVWEQYGQCDAKLRNGRVHPAVAVAVHYSGDAREYSAPEIYDQWAEPTLVRVIGMFALRYRSGPRSYYDDRNTLASLERIKERVLLSNQLSPRLVVTPFVFPQHPFQLLARSGRVDSSKLIELLQRWSDDPRLTVSIYGQMTLLSLKAANSIPTPISAKDIETASNVEKQLERFGREHPDQQLHVASCLKIVATAKSRLQAALGGQLASSARLKPWTSTGGIDPTPRLTFEPLSGVVADWVAIRRCNDQLDLLSSWNRVGLMEEPGKVREIFKTSFSPIPTLGREPGDQIYVAGWDGELVWVASSKSGVQVFDRQGRQIRQFRTDASSSSSDVALPPITVNSNVPTGLHASDLTPLWLHPLEPGRCFVMGQVGRDGRRWYGCLERTDAGNQTWRYAAWHETKKQAARPLSAADDDLDEIFQPSNFLDYRDSKSQERWLLFGRPSIDFKAPRRPLAFNTETGAVTVFPQAVARGMTGWSLPMIDDVGAVVDPAYTQSSRAVPQADGSFRFDPVIPVVRGPAKPVEPSAVRRLPAFLRRELIAHGEWLYWPGKEWRRVNRQTGEVQLMTPTPVRPRFDFEYFSVSAHYGMIAWNHGDVLHRVLVDQPRDEAREADWLYPFVPDALRERHHQAVLAIRDLGGEADTVPLHSNVLNLRKTKRWRTAVYLSSAWRGGDAGMKHLRDLFEVQELVLCNAPVTDDGLHVVAELKALQSLVVLGTKITNAGLESVNKLPELSQLWLEPAPGSTSLSDDGLAILAGHRTLRALTLVDRGFTDAAIPHLLKIPQVYELRLTETATTAAGIAALKKQRPQVWLLAETNQ